MQTNTDANREPEKERGGGVRACLRVERIWAASSGPAPPMEKPLLSNSARISASIASPLFTRCAVECGGYGGRRRRGGEERKAEGSGLWALGAERGGDVGGKWGDEMAGKTLLVGAVGSWRTKQANPN